MTYSNSEIIEILSNVLNVDAAELNNIDPNDHLERYGLVSINTIKLISLLEEKYEFEFRDEDLIFDKFNTLNKLYVLLNNY